MKKQLLAFTERLSERQDVILAVFVVSVIFMLIIPLPTTLVDVLIASNMSIAVILLMVAVYLSSPLDFAAFPSVLLITTLFRLALSISTTRLILLQADAGRIVETFGNFVVGGNLVVGLVIFLILTIVQFVVITKGAERVAEVSARFSLDALPGKQLSIDADMRAGAISLEEARAARNRIQRESKLYGSMDGAMKFVKGDAIAGLIVVFVNLLGGLAIGVLQRGLSFGEAIHIYSILTIGDGLIGQIPALFISITAGIIVTRVTDDSQNANLGRDIGSQIGHQPRALLVAAGMLIVFALVPGFPAIVFLVLSAFLGGPSLLHIIAAKRKARARQDPVLAAAPSAPEHEGRGEFSAAHDDIFAPTVPLLVELPAISTPQLGSIDFIRERINQVRLNIYYRLGVTLPVIDVRFHHSAEEARYRIFVAEIPASDGVMRSDALFIFSSAENLDLFHIPYSTSEDFLPGHPSLWVDTSHRADLDAAQLRYKPPLELLNFHCEQVFARYADQFLGIQDVKRLFEKMETTHPELVKETQRALPVQVIAELLRRLVQEYVSIRDISRIFGAIVEWAGREKDPILLVEHIRSALARQISYQYSVANNILPALMLEHEIEETVRNAIRQTSSGSYLAMEPETSTQLVERVRKAAKNSASEEAHPVLLTALDIRRYVRRLIEQDVPELPVLSFQEITPEINLQPLGRVG